MSDHELFSYFKNHNDNVCDSFSAFQTDRIIALHSKQNKFFNISSITASLVALLISFAGKAQTTDTLKTRQPIEISPLPPKSIKVTDQPEETVPILQDNTIGNQLQGKLGGVCVKPVVIGCTNKCRN